MPELSPIPPPDLVGLYHLAHAQLSRVPIEPYGHCSPSFPRELDLDNPIHLDAKTNPGHYALPVEIGPDYTHLLPVP